MTSRANPFADLEEFTPKEPARAVPVAAIEQIAEESGFPSRKARSKPAAVKEREPQQQRQMRRYTTGRNRQINIKATSETIDRLYQLADQRGVPLGALLEEALDALEQQSGR